MSRMLIKSHLSRGVHFSMNVEGFKNAPSLPLLSPLQHLELEYNLVSSTLKAIALSIELNEISTGPTSIGCM
jgi:hypothetical protein